MSKLKFSFLVLMLMVSVSASADWAPADVQAALKKMYPTADDVAWSHDESYYPKIRKQSQWQSQLQ